MIKIDKKKIGGDNRCFIICEMSGNHNQSYDRAVEIIKAAKDCGADAVKIQTYTADTITINSNRPEFMTESGGLWEGQTLYELYQKAYTPWEWQKDLKQIADQIGIILFSSPFDHSAVDFLESIDVPAYKVASFEINDIPLLQKIAKTEKPIFMSTGVATREDVELAVKTCRNAGNEKIVLLKCTSEYPAIYKDMNIGMIKDLETSFRCTVGLSDHSMGAEVALGAVALGAKVIEKHFTLCRNEGGVDAAFSMEPHEMKDMIQRIRNLEDAIGIAEYGLLDKDVAERRFMRSLYVVKEMKAGEVFTEENIKSIRPGLGMHPKYYYDVIGKTASCDIAFATPLSRNLVEGF